MARSHVVVVDGSNIATEGRSTPSLAQLDEAVRQFQQEFPEAEVIVVVDASFGRRIDPSERAAFDDAVAHGEAVSPPAGAVGRGDAFLLRIAERVGGQVLSNDSFQEFHAEHPWLFDEGRLIGGKPVPGVGWFFTLRSPVRGARSRAARSAVKRGAVAPPAGDATLAATTASTTKAAKAAKKAGTGQGDGTGAKAKTTARAGQDAGSQSAPSSADRALTAGRAANADKTARPAKTARTAKTTKGTEPARPATPDKSAKADKRGKPAKATEAGRPVKAAKAAKTGKPARTAKTAMPAKAGKPAQVDKPAKAAKTAKGDNAAKGDKAATAGKSAKVAKTGRRQERRAPAPSVRAAIDAATVEAVAPTVDVTQLPTAAGRRRRSASAPEAVNDPLTFLTFVTEHPLGSSVEGEVSSFMSHGAMVNVDGMQCYLPLAGLGAPAPRRAREVLVRGEHRRFVVVGLDPPRRGAELALPELARARMRVASQG